MCVMNFCPLRQVAENVFDYIERILVLIQTMLREYVICGSQCYTADISLSEGKNIICVTKRQFGKK